MFRATESSVEDPRDFFPWSQNHPAAAAGGKLRFGNFRYQGLKEGAEMPALVDASTPLGSLVRASIPRPHPRFNSPS